MGYNIEGREVDLSGIKKLTFTPSQKAGDVYKFKNYALRIFREGEEPIDEATAEYLTGIKTNRIILPKKLLFYNNAFKGYTMKLVSQRGAGKRISTAPKREVIDSVRALEDDISLLSQKRILLNGATPGYTLYNGELYLVDPSNYRILETNNIEQLKRLNQYQLHLLITELISSDLKKINIQQSHIQQLKDLLQLGIKEESTSSYLDDLMQDHKNIKELVKKIS